MKSCTSALKCLRSGLKPSRTLLRYGILFASTTPGAPSDKHTQSPRRLFSILHTMNYLQSPVSHSWPCWTSRNSLDSNLNSVFTNILRSTDTHPLTTTIRCDSLQLRYGPDHNPRPNAGVLNGYACNPLGWMSVHFWALTPGVDARLKMQCICHNCRGVLTHVD
jgi:hypothetical protein